MYKKRLALTLPAADLTTAAQFTTTLTALFDNGKGRGSNFAAALPLRESDALRVLVGVPDNWLSDERQLLCEAVYNHAFARPFAARPELWQAPAWQPQNPARVAAPLAESVFDEAFAQSLGIRLSVWEKEILIADLGSYRQRQRRGESTADANLRFLIALAMFGFADPWQFFTAQGAAAGGY